MAKCILQSIGNIYNKQHSDISNEVFNGNLHELHRLVLPGGLALMLRSLLDREARVLRYRERKKTKKFEKKIRYDSRKGSAETRPWIKGPSSN